MCSGETVRDALLFTNVKFGETIHANLITDSMYTSVGSAVSLYSVLKPLSDKAMMSFLMRTYFTGGQIGGGQKTNLSGGRTASLAEFTVNVIRDGRKIGQVGSGLKTVDLQFLIDSPVDWN
jgi:hypothetical protein